MLIVALDELMASRCSRNYSVGQQANNASSVATANTWSASERPRMPLATS